MINKKLKFVVYAPSFDENSGGVIALHKLCDILNKNGEETFLVPSFSKKYNFIFNMLRILKNILFYKTSKSLTTPISYSILKNYGDDYVIIYPEIVSGNPLNAKNVVRWLLHKPGFHTGEVNYGKEDIFFFYQVIFNDPKLNIYDDHLLTVLWVRDDIYKQTNFGERKGTCYMIRKGKDRKVIHDTKNSVLLDGMSHNEIAKIMNQCKYFISYDMETMYSQYAVLCGCISIVVPEDGVSKDEWQPKKEFQYGIAYGFDDIEEAEKTKNLVNDVLKKIENDSNSSVIVFIEKIYKLLRNEQ